MKSIVSLLLLAKQTFSSSSHWDYDHMTEWSNEYSMCGVADESPIDIQTLDAVIDPDVCGANLEWKVDFSKQMYKIANNGHSISLKPVQEIINDEGEEEYISLSLNDNTVAKFPNYFATTSKHQEYCLDSIHFHWGTSDVTGSEHLVDGYQYPLEAHFVHYSCDHASLGSTLETFPTQKTVENGNELGLDTHQLGVIGVFFDVVEDRTNPVFDAIFDNDTLTHISFPDGHHDAEIVEGFDLSQLIPDHINTEGYYAYKGSLTTPPCTNIVNWHVMNARGYIGKSQLAKFRELMSTDIYEIAPNYREVQNNANTVYSCVDVKTKQVVVEKENPETIALVAVVASLITAIVIGIIFLVIYYKKKQNLIDEINANNKRSQINKNAQKQTYGQETNV